MTFPIDHLSASFVKSYMDCHLKGLYYKERRPSTFDKRYAEAGSVVHSDIERIFNPGAEPFQPNPELIDGQMERRIAESLDGFGMIQRRLRRLTPGNGQLAEWEFRWHPEPDVEFLGYIDLLTLGDTVFVDDWKTGAENQKDELQMVLYKTAVSELMAVPTSRIVTTLHYLRQAKSKEVPYVGARETRQWLKANVIDPIRELDFRANKGPQCARCEYRAICRAWES